MSGPVLIAIAAMALALAVIISAAAWVGPRVSRALLGWAARRCFDTDEQRERFAEEWLADLDDVPGRLAKLAHTLGVLLLAAAPIWGRSVWRRSRLARRLDRGTARTGPGLAGIEAGGAAVLARAGALVLVLAVIGLVAVPSVASTLRLIRDGLAPAAAPALTGLVNPDGPPPGSLTCATATVCYDLGDPASGAQVLALYGSGRLYVSTDGAEFWRTIPLPAGLTITSALVCQTASICSAGAEEHGRPAFAVTRDGGRRWTTSPLPSAAGVILRLSCPAVTTCRALAGTVVHKRFDSRAVTMLSATYHLLTTDDGRHFTSSALPAANTIHLLSCPTTSHCVATGYRVTLVSDDGGGTWHRATLPRGVLPDTSLGCVDAQHCFQVAGNGNGSELIVSDDGGATWQPRPLPARYPHPGIQDLTCVSASTCYIMGVDDTPQSFDDGKAISGSTPIAAVTQDAGLTWQGIGLPGSGLPLQSGEPPDAFYSVALQCTIAGACVGLANNVAGFGHTAIYRSSAPSLTSGGVSGWAAAGGLTGDLGTIAMGGGLVRVLRGRLRRQRLATLQSAGPR